MCANHAHISMKSVMILILIPASKFVSGPEMAML